VGSFGPDHVGVRDLDVAEGVSLCKFPHRRMVVEHEPGMSDDDVFPREQHHLLFRISLAPTAYRSELRLVPVPQGLVTKLPQCHQDEMPTNLQHLFLLPRGSHRAVQAGQYYALHVGASNRLDS